MFYEEKLLEKLFLSSGLDRDVKKCREAMIIVIKSMTIGTDVSGVFSHVMKLLASNDYIVKKLACLYITNQSEQSDLLLLAINTLVKDCADSNPMVRGLALKTITSLRQENLLEYCISPVLKGLRDRSVYVRRVAVLSCIRLNKASPNFITDHGIVDILYSMIRDSDPIIMVNCLSVLEEILKKEGGVVINKNISYYLLNRLGLVTEWGLVEILVLLKRYRPKTEDEVFAIMNILDSFLKHFNCAVVHEALKLFLHLIKDMPHLRSQVFSRVIPSLLQFLQLDNHEINHIQLDFLIENLDDIRDALSTNYKTFFCKQNEPVFVKVKKIQLLSMLISDDNFSDILDELYMYCSDSSSESRSLVATVIRAVGGVFKNSTCPNRRRACLTKLLNLIQLEFEFIVSEVIQVLQVIDLSDEDDLGEILETLPKCMDIVSDGQSQCAVLWLLGQYGEYVEESPYLLERFVSQFDDIEIIDSKICLSLLTCSMKLFLKKPAECQELLGKVFEFSLTQDNVDVKQRAHFYYRLLSVDVLKAKIIVSGDIL